jgi:glutathione S-transferase
VTAPTLAIYRTPLSGHSHRVEAFVVMLGLPYTFIDTPAAARRTPEFRARNPLGQIPVLKDGELVLADSDAILVYLARRYGAEWLPTEAVAAAQVQRWLSIAAGELKYGPAAARIACVWGAGDPAGPQAIARSLFQYMDAHLTGRAYLATDRPTIADLACYAYTAHAPEGGVSLDPYPAIRAWIARVEALPNFKPMPRSARPAGG